MDTKRHPNRELEVEMEMNKLCEFVCRWALGLESFPATDDLVTFTLNGKAGEK